MEKVFLGIYRVLGKTEMFKAFYLKGGINIAVLPTNKDEKYIECSVFEDYKGDVIITDSYDSVNWGMTSDEVSRLKMAIRLNLEDWNGNFKFKNVFA